MSGIVLVGLANEKGEEKDSLAMVGEARRRANCQVRLIWSGPGVHLHC